MQIMKREIRGGSALLTAYIQDKSEAIHASEARPAVLIFPGGGYEFVSDPEGEPVALAYAAKGFQTFVLKYSVKDKGVFPAPQREAFEAIAVIRRNAAEFMVDPDKIAVVGFSAGGHLAASTGVFWNDAEVNDSKSPEECRPNALVLVYPCITTGEFAYSGIRDVHGKGLENIEKLSLEKYVGKQTPPSFICHTAADTCVPAINSLLFAEALARAGVPYELRIYKDGPHGMSLATKAVSSPYLLTFDETIQRAVRDVCARFSEWFDKSAEFLRLVFDGVSMEKLLG